MSHAVHGEVRDLVAKRANASVEPELHLVGDAEVFEADGVGGGDDGDVAARDERLEEETIGELGGGVLHSPQLMQEEC